MGRDQDKFEHFQHHRHTQNVDLDAEIVGAKPFTLVGYILYMSAITYWPKRIGEVFRLAAGQTQHWPWLSKLQLKMVHKEARLMLLGYGIIAIISIQMNSFAVLTLWLLPMLMMKCFQNLQKWNMPYHTAHHSYPMVPFHRLGELHEAVVESLGSQPPTVTHLGFQRQMIRKLMIEGTSAYTGQDITAY